MQGCECWFGVVRSSTHNQGFGGGKLSSSIRMFRESMMSNHVENEFDFNDWAGLYLENPQEFEARRQAALMIELAKGTPEQAKAGRALLEAYEKRVQGCDPAERLQAAVEMMSDSAQQLGTELMLLKQNVENCVSGHASDADVVLEKIMTENDQQKI